MMEAELWLSPVIGVSMGACNGANYVSRQQEPRRGQPEECPRPDPAEGLPQDCGEVFVIRPAA